MKCAFGEFTYRKVTLVHEDVCITKERKKKTADFYEQVVVGQFDAIDATYVSRHTNVSLHSIEFPMGRFALQNIAVSTSHCT